MKYRLKSLGILSISLIFYACADNHDHDHDHDPAHEHSATKGEIINEEHDDEISLTPEMAEKFGVEIYDVEPGKFNDVIETAGQIVDAPGSTSVISAPTSGIIKFSTGIAPGAPVTKGRTIATIVSDNISGGNADAAAKAALDAAKRELDRLKPLYDEKLVTIATYNEALATYEQARAAYSSHAASGRAVASSSGVITSLDVQDGAYVTPGQQLATISATTNLTLRADLPEKYFSRIGDIASANIILPYSGEVVELSKLGAKKINGTNAASATKGYVPLYFTFANNGKVLPGSYVDVLLIGAEHDNIITVPAEAISEQQGAFFVYEQIHSDAYEKVPVKVGTKDGNRVEIISGLYGGEKIVGKGVIAVRLAENAGAVPEGHSHTH